MSNAVKTEKKSDGDFRVFYGPDQAENKEPEKEFDTFGEAFSYLYDKVQHDIEDEKLSFQVLYEYVWIEHEGHPILFEMAKEIAWDIGLLEQGSEGPILAENYEEDSDELESLLSFSRLRAFAEELGRLSNFLSARSVMQEK